MGEGLPLIGEGLPLIGDGLPVMGEGLPTEPFALWSESTDGIEDHSFH